MEEAVLSWRKPNISYYLILNKTQHVFVTDPSEDSTVAVVADLGSCNTSAYYQDPKNC